MNLIKEESGLPEDKSGRPEERRVFTSQELFQKQREIIILHGEARYRLRLTKTGKLILNK